LDENTFLAIRENENFDETCIDFCKISSKSFREMFLRTRKFDENALKNILNLEVIL
jgi:hypothetical protein